MAFIKTGNESNNEEIKIFDNVEEALKNTLGEDKNIICDKCGNILKNLKCIKCHIEKQ